MVLDYFMPDMNGGDVAAELRRRRPDVPIIFLSAYFSLPPEALELANAFITKGDPPDALMEKIEQLVCEPANPESSAIANWFQRTSAGLSRRSIGCAE